MTFDALAQSSGGDTLTYTGSTDAVTVNLSGTQSATGFATIAGVENVTGGSGNDTLTGDGGANVLDGGLGSDTLDGGDGADTIVYDGSDVSIAGGDGDGHAEGQRGGDDRPVGRRTRACGDTAVVTGFENVDASGSSVAVTLTGDDDANVLTGGSTATTRSTGGLGADTVSGGGRRRHDPLHDRRRRGHDRRRRARRRRHAGGARDGGRRHARRDRDAGRRSPGLTGGTVTGIETVTYDALAQSTGGDTLCYTGSTDAVTVNLSGTQSATGFATIAGVENVTGGSGNDTLTGDGSANVLERRRRTTRSAAVWAPTR